MIKIICSEFREPGPDMIDPVRYAPGFRCHMQAASLSFDALWLKAMTMHRTIHSHENRSAFALGWDISVGGFARCSRGPEDPYMLFQLGLYASHGSGSLESF